MLAKLSEVRRKCYIIIYHYTICTLQHRRKAIIFSLTSHLNNTHEPNHPSHYPIHPPTHPEIPPRIPLLPRRRRSSSTIRIRPRQRPRKRRISHTRLEPRLRQRNHSRRITDRSRDSRAARAERDDCLTRGVGRYANGRHISS